MVDTLIKMKGGGAHSAARPVLDIRGKILATADETPPLSDGAVAGATALCAVGRAWLPRCGYSFAVTRGGLFRSLFGPRGARCNYSFVSPPASLVDT